MICGAVDNRDRPPGDTPVVITCSGEYYTVHSDTACTHLFIFPLSLYTCTCTHVFLPICIHCMDIGTFLLYTYMCVIPHTQAFMYSCIAKLYIIHIYGNPLFIQ